MRSYYFCITVFLLLTLCVRGAGLRRDLEAQGDWVIADKLSAEYQTYRTGLVHDHGTNDARAAISLLDKAKAYHCQNLADDKLRRQSACVYEGAWQICIRTMLSSKDEGSHRIFLDKWDKSLGEENIAVATQIHSLGLCWDRRFLTPRFWRLWHETSNSKIILSISYLLSIRGDMGDVAQLKAKMKSGISVEQQMIINKAVELLVWRLRDDKTKSTDGPPEIFVYEE